MHYSDLGSLHIALAACRKCPEAFYHVESLPVFSRVQQARMMLIGQAPGIAEVDTLVPFSGDAGRRLFQWMARVGWEEASFRQQCYITSVTKCFPGRNPSGEGDRVPSAGEQKLCQPWLTSEITLVSPRLIIAVGSLAISKVMPNKAKLNEIIGESFQDAEGRHIVPLPHPSGASRWLNQPMNAGRLERAIFRLRTLKSELSL